MLGVLIVGMRKCVYVRCTGKDEDLQNPLLPLEGRHLIESFLDV